MIEPSDYAGQYLEECWIAGKEPSWSLLRVLESLDRVPTRPPPPLPPGVEQPAPHYRPRSLW